jgi:transcriptional regulator GlxA family with amidase domain
LRTVGTLLFPGFELLDVFGPLEMFGALAQEYRLETTAESAGAVESRQGTKAIADIALSSAKPYDILLIPGGYGTRREVGNEALIDWLRGHAEASSVVATVCTGAALLARTGLLDGRKATTNKASFRWVAEQGPNVRWQPRARWVVDGKYFTSSGVSAGMDMALALISNLSGAERAQQVATYTEYRWNSDPNDDPFCDASGLGDTMEPGQPV